jgi:hypothetical protein
VAPNLGKVGVSSGNTSERYPPELKERAVRMVAEVRGDHESEWAEMTNVGSGSALEFVEWAVM